MFYWYIVKLYLLFYSEMMCFKVSFHRNFNKEKMMKVRNVHEEAYHH